MIVYIKSIHEPFPIYHAEELREPFRYMYTLCGSVSSFGGESVRLPEVWANKFASKCGDCFK